MHTSQPAVHGSISPLFSNPVLTLRAHHVAHLATSWSDRQIGSKPAKDIHGGTVVRCRAIRHDTWFMFSSLLQKISEPSAPTDVAIVLTCCCVADVIIPIPPPTTPAPGGNLIFMHNHRVRGAGTRYGWYVVQGAIRYFRWVFCQLVLLLQAHCTCRWGALWGFPWAVRRIRVRAPFDSNRRVLGWVQHSVRRHLFG